MNKRELRVVSACADALFPSGGVIPVSGTQAGLTAYVESYLEGLPWRQRILVRMLFWFIELSPWVYGPRYSRFTRLSPADRIRVLGDMAVSRQYFRRVAFLSLRAILTMGYFACPQVDALIMGKQRGAVSS